MGNEHGRANAFTVVSHIRPWAAGPLGLALRALDYFESSQETAKLLRFLHFARWAIVRDENLPDRQEKTPPRRLRRKVLLFCTSYNGDWDDYIGTFSRVLAFPLDLVWRCCVDFPGAVPAAGLKRYIRENDHDAAFYHCAYSVASVHDVREALDLYARLEALADDTAPSGSRYVAFAEAARAGLGSPRPPQAAAAGSAPHVPSHIP